MVQTFQKYADVGARQRFRSDATSTLVVPPTRRATLGDRVFPVAATRAWNALPLSQGRSIVSAVPPGTEDDTVSCVLRLKTALQLLLTIILYSAPATVL